VAQPVFERDSRRVADCGVDAVERGAGLGHVGGLRRQEFELGFAPDKFLQHAHKKQCFDGPMVADVEEPKWRDRWGEGRVEEELEEPIANVVDIGEIAPHAAFGEELERLARVNRLSKEGRGGVGPPPRAIDIEKAQSCEREPVLVSPSSAKGIVALAP